MPLFRRLRTQVGCQQRADTATGSSPTAWSVLRRYPRPATVRPVEPRHRWLGALARCGRYARGVYGHSDEVRLRAPVDIQRAHSTRVERTHNLHDATTESPMRFQRSKIRDGLT